MGWITAIIKAIGAGYAIFKSIVAQNKQTAHDNLVRDDQEKTDALQGESDALKQVDKISSAVDTGGVPIASDPENRNR